jgi:hypothetical protein
MRCRPFAGSGACEVSPALLGAAALRRQGLGSVNNDPWHFVVTVLGSTVTAIRQNLGSSCKTSPVYTTADSRF